MKEATVAKQYELGTVFGLRLSVIPAFASGTIILWIVLSGVGMGVLQLPLSQAVTGGLVATLLYWVSYIVHHLGHAYAARRIGYPMSGIRLGYAFIFGTSLYPKDEGALPAVIHIRRALGGPIGSLLFSIVTGGIALLLRSAEPVVWWTALFVFLTNFVVLTLGAFLPLGFTDGSTLLEWWGKR
jgi:Zn-dependent protease